MEMLEMMEVKKRLDLPQVQKRLLGIATVVDGICRRHEIPLYMIAGTMLGAVRHKGFIPWDDDMDFAVPYEHYYGLIQVLREELPVKMRCLTFDVSETYSIPWIKVEDTETVVYDGCLDLPKEKMPGLTIDIFPLVSCGKEGNDGSIKKIQRWLTIQRIAYSKSIGSNSKIKNVVKRMIRFFTPWSAKAINNKIKKLVSGIPEGDYYTIPVDPNYYGRYFPKEWFSPLVNFKFEDCELFGVTNYDKYLTALYHDYMQLPPEGERRVHFETVFVNG